MMEGDREKHAKGGSNARTRSRGTDSMARRIRNMELLNEYMSSERYNKISPPWVGGPISGWGLNVGTSHVVRYVGRVLSKPVSILPAIFIRASLSEDYKAMFRSLNSVYARVERADLPYRGTKELLQVEGGYAVAWVPKKSMFYRVRVIDLDDGVVVHCFDYNFVARIEPRHLYPIVVQFLKLLPRVVLLYIDGYEHLGRNKTLFRIMRETKIAKGQQLTFKVTRHLKAPSPKMSAKIFGDIYLEGRATPINSSALFKLWSQGRGPAIPPVKKFGAGKSAAMILHAKMDGTIFMNFKCPVTAALYCYLEQAGEKLSQLRSQGPKGTQELRAKLPMSPHVMYLLWNPDEGSTKKVFRVQVCKGQQGGQGKADDKVWVRFIDVGKYLEVSPSCLYSAKSVNPVLAVAPALLMRAHLANISSLNVERFMAEMAIKSPMVLCTRRAETREGPAEVHLWFSRKVGVRKPDLWLSLEEECLNAQIAQRMSRPMEEKDYPGAQPGQLCNIKMLKSSVNWGPQSSSSDTTDTPTLLAVGERIYFKLSKVITANDFMIQPYGAPETLTSISETIKAHVEKPWVRKGLSLEADSKSYAIPEPSYFYGYFSKQKNLYTRVRLVELDSVETATVLLIDYAEYREVPLTDFLPLPIKLRSIGPQAALVINYRPNCNVYFSSLERLVELDERKLSGFLEYLQHDSNQLSLLTLKNIVVHDD